MKQYKLIAKTKKGHHTVTLCNIKSYAQRLKTACEKLDKKRTYEIIVVGNKNRL